MDLSSLLAWRSSCIINYAHATAALKRSLISVINPFLSHPANLLRIISRYGAVIGGEGALAFVRRPRTFQPHSLEIFTSASLYASLCHEVLTDPLMLPDIITTISTVYQYPQNAQREVLETTQIILRNTRSIYIRRSSTLSPLSPIVRSICTALVNFVTPHSFGCAYPLLTLNDKSLLSGLAEGTLGEFDTGILRLLAEQQIDTAVDPSSWPQYRLWSPDLSIPNTSGACWRSHYICPNQGRFFGDGGSIVDFVDPIGIPTPTLQEQGHPPFGTVVIWRMYSSYQCPLACESRDNTLPVGQMSTPVIMMDDPFPYTRGRSVMRGRTAASASGYSQHIAHAQKSRSTSL